jgi:hypothetical protein
MPKFLCLRDTYGFLGRYHEKGDVIEVGQSDLGHPSLRAHFQPVNAAPVARSSGNAGTEKFKAQPKKSDESAEKSED